MLEREPELADGAVEAVPQLAGSGPVEVGTELGGAQGGRRVGVAAAT
jgi:hypothetical protein